MTNNIVCSSCGGAGHISKDCRSKRPGQGGPTASNNQTKIDEEYMSLMAELGEVQPNAQESNGNNNNNNSNNVQQPNRSFSIFDNRQQAPRPLMAPPPLLATPSNANNAPLPPWSQNNQPSQPMIPPLMGINPNHWSQGPPPPSVPPLPHQHVSPPPLPPGMCYSNIKAY